jgi:type IV pilus biogenesis/stability protein PilW
MSSRGKKSKSTAPPAQSTVAPAAVPAPRCDPPALAARPLPVRQAPLSRKRSADWVVCLLLGAAVFAVFGQTARHQFINLDDDEYVYENREVRAGLTLHGLRAAFLRPLGVNWHPLTTLSHMLDCQVYGLRADGHHLTSVLLHALTAVALYLVLRRMTGRGARSAFAAFLFALHPLRVESVSWVAERKDVLSGLFFVLTLAAYLGYVRTPSSVLRTLLVPCVFALGLMCKPMLVTVPIVLLLLDYWPLGRFAGGIAGSALPPLPISRLLLEKLPLFILAACSCAITLVLQTSAMPTLQRISLAYRMGNSLLAYAGYLKLFFWPFGLAVYYPYSDAPPNPWSLIAAGLVLAGVSYLAWTWRRRRPYLIVGWLWYLVMLAPVIGLVQVGYQSMADRYTYLPMIGPVVTLVWLVADAARASVNRRFAVSLSGSLAVLALAGLAAWQTTYWRDNLTLWTRTLDCTTGNYNARLHLGLAWSERGRTDKAIEQYDEALRVNPDFSEARFDLACALSTLSQIESAQRQYEAAIKIRPNYAKARNNLGMLLFNRGDVPAAAEQFRQALDVDPNYAMAHNNLGLTLMAAGQYADAAASYRRALELDPDFPQPHANLGLALGKLGQSAEAVAEFESFLRVQPNNSQVLGWLAWVLATARDDAVRNGPLAVELARKAVALSNGSDPRILDALAAAYAESGQLPAAIKTAEAASDLAAASGQNGLAAEIRQRLVLYRESRAFRE